MKIGGKMKTAHFFSAFIVLAMLMCTISAQTTFDNSLSMANVSVSPNPVVAGGNAVIHFKLYDAYDVWLYGTTLQPSGTYPLINASPLNEVLIGMVNPGLDNKNYTYTFPIPNTLPSGTYTITFTSRYFIYAGTGSVVATSSMPVTFYVQNKPSIKVTAQSPNPATLYTGHNQTVDLAVENTGYGTARNVSVYVSTGPGTDILSSVTSFFISNLTQGQTIDEPILISAENTTQAELFANINYYSSALGQKFSSAQNISLSVVPAAQFSIASGSESVGIGATDVPVTFKITNTGTSPAEQVQLSLETTYPIAPVASTAYISDLPAGASTNVTFLVSVDSQGVEGNYPVSLYEQWKQPNGAADQQFTGENNYFVAVGSTAGNATQIYIIIIIIVIGAAVYMYKKRAANKHKQKK